MAIFRPGPLVSEIRGSVGGTTFSRNPAGQIIRQRSNPVNPNSSRQQTVRTVLATISNRWGNILTQAQRDAWDTYAAAVTMTNRLGDPFFLAGFQHYVRSNTAILQAGGIVVDDGPTVLSLPSLDPTWFGAASLLSGATIIFDNTMAWANEDDAWMSASMSSPVGPGRSFIGGPFRFAGAFEGDSVTPPTSPHQFTQPWTIAVGQKVIVRSRIMRADGRLSSWMQSLTAVGA